MKHNNHETSIENFTKPANKFPVVGVGASAGGLAAFKEFIRAIPKDSGLAYVLVQHLDPGRESMLPELLGKCTSIPIVEISDKMMVKPNHVYIIPSNCLLLSNEGRLELSPRPQKEERIPNLPIDVFFKSLAEVHREKAIGVVLTGNGSDGTAGLKAIKDRGGITFAQNEETAEYSSMPRHAIMEGYVDFILPPRKIPKRIIEVISNFYEPDGREKN